MVKFTYVIHKGDTVKMGLKQITINDLQTQTEQIINNVINEDKFCEIHYEDDSAVIISKAEWNIMVEALSMVLNCAILK